MRVPTRATLSSRFRSYDISLLCFVKVPDSAFPLKMICLVTNSALTYQHNVKTIAIKNQKNTDWDFVDKYISKFLKHNIYN